MPTQPADVQTPADMVDYLTHLATQMDRAANDVAPWTDRDAHFRYQGRAAAYRDAARIAAIVADHVESDGGLEDAILDRVEPILFETGR
ncbi:MAG TPA: hypothetical protein VG795_09115 [Acidimicrobiia bacterium]|nr:hypothetical protein [Acidimicrobiia bacterium]